MAKNWTVAEATEAILNGNKEAIVDIGKRFPLAMKAITVAGDKAKDILSAFNFITVRKVESILKDGVEEYSEDDVEDPTEKPVKKAKAEEKKPAKEKKSPAKKDEKPAKKTTKKEEAMNEPEEEDEEDYASMSEVELFKVCKAKGLKPAPKQKKKYYLDLLKSAEDDEEDWEEEEDEKPAKKAPAKKGKKAAEDEDDDWDI